MPLRCNDFLCCEADGLGFVCCVGKNSSVTDNYAHDEEGASEVAEECKDPVLEHLKNAGAAVECGHCRKLCNESVLDKKKSSGCHGLP